MAMSSDEESTYSSAAGYSHTWYADPPESSASRPPYQQVAVSLLNDSNRFKRVGKGEPRIIKNRPAPKAALHCVDFFPFGEPDVEQLRRTQGEEVRQRQRIHRSRKPAEDDENDAGAEQQIGLFGKMIKQWQGVFAVCGGQRIILARPSQEEKMQFMWHLDIKDDELYHLAWSYDPLTFEPLIAVGGALGLIYIIEPGAHKIRRTLKGHGDWILSVKFSPTDPHILASASGDRTVRVWNVFGGDLADDLDQPSRNFPMGDADEGDACVCILAGEGAAGHKWDVEAVAFHPTQRAIVTCGMDFGVRIWALPEYPEITNSAPYKTPQGYRPQVVRFPIFGTNRLHEDAVDCIDWLTEDVLISQTRCIVIVWQWLGYARYFGTDKASSRSQRSDWFNSHSFRILAHYPLPGAFWYRRFGLHQAWGEHDEAESQHGHTSGSLLAVIDGVTQKILVFNPMHIKYPDVSEIVPPRFSGRNDQNPIDVDTNTLPALVALDSSPVVALPAVKEEGDDDGLKVVPIVTGKTSRVVPSLPQVPLLQPWTLPPRSLQSAMRKVCGHREKGSVALHTVAISPRGAQYVVAVGTHGSIVLFQLESPPLREG